jgi:hypothetical protein
MDFVGYRIFFLKGYQRGHIRDKKNEYEHRNISYLKPLSI